MPSTQVPAGPHSLAPRIGFQGKRWRLERRKGFAEGRRSEGGSLRSAFMSAWDCWHSQGPVCRSLQCFFVVRRKAHCRREEYGKPYKRREVHKSRLASTMRRCRKVPGLAFMSHLMRERKRLIRQSQLKSIHQKAAPIHTRNHSFTNWRKERCLNNTPFRLIIILLKSVFGP